MSLIGVLYAATCCGLGTHETVMRREIGWAAVRRDGREADGEELDWFVQDVTEFLFSKIKLTHQHAKRLFELILYLHPCFSSLFFSIIDTLWI